MKDLLPELCDQYPELIELLPPCFRGFGGREAFGGQVVTVRCLEDNSLVRQVLSEPGNGKVLVVDGGGMSRRALLGDMLAQKAVDNGWRGVVVFGHIRDVNAIAEMDIGVQALGATPMKTNKLGFGERDVEIEIEGIRVKPNSYLYADNNGAVVTDEPLPLAQQELAK